MDGVLIVDKPTGMTSHDVVDILRRLTCLRRVGHAGSLDPNATGVLLLLLGNATKISRWLMLLDKEYLFTIQLGLETTTNDRWGEILKHCTLENLEEMKVRDVLMSFEGKHRQVAPAVSALKHKGRPLYKIARQGGRIPSKTRTVEIRNLRILDILYPFVTVQLECSSGTYVRAIARDVGRKLGCGATVFCLRRIRIGSFRAQDAVPLEALMRKQIRVAERLLPIEETLNHLPKVKLRRGVAHDLRLGRQPQADDLIGVEALPKGDFCLIDSDGKVVAIASSVGRKSGNIRIERIL